MEFKGTKYTHLAKIYNIPCYFNIETGEILGTNKIYDLLIEFFVSIDLIFSLFNSNDQGFEIKLIREL